MPERDGALPTPRGVKLTYDDFVLFPDDGLRHELIDGERHVTPSPSIKHQQVSAQHQPRDRDVLARPAYRTSLLCSPGCSVLAFRHRRAGPDLHVGASDNWVVDPELDVVRVYRRDGQRFARPHELSAESGDVLTTPLLPGLELALSDIFRM